MKFEGRKATAWIVFLVWSSVLIALIVFVDIETKWIGVIMLIVSSVFFLTVAFIGGTIWKDYIKSKYFRQELFDKGGK